MIEKMLKDEELKEMIKKYKENSKELKGMIKKLEKIQIVNLKRYFSI